MPPTPKFVERLGRLPEVLALLAAYPDGLELESLAGQFGVGSEELRQDLTTLMDLDSWGWMHDIFHPPVLEFVGHDDEETDEAGTVVRVVNDSPTVGIGVDRLSAGDLALLYTAGLALLDAESDPDLQEALAIIAETIYGEPAFPPSPAEWNRFLPLLKQAQAEKRRVDIVYSRAWHVGVTERIIEPLQLVQTHRGWEVDAGPLGAEGNLRTFLLSNIREARVREEHFEPPRGVASELRRQRQTTSVRMALAQDARWAPDMYAEKVEVVSEDDAVFVADLELLPPVGERIGLLMLASGGDTRVLEPTSLLQAGNDVILGLIAHHESPPR